MAYDTDRHVLTSHGNRLVQVYELHQRITQAPFAWFYRITRRGATKIWEATRPIRTFAYPTLKTSCTDRLLTIGSVSRQKFAQVAYCFCRRSLFRLMTDVT